MSKSKEEIAAAYDSAPWWYDLRGFFILTFAYNSTLPHQLEFFGPNMGPQHLEVACGTGTLLQYVMQWRKMKELPETHVFGIDYAESMLAGAQHRFAKRSNMEFLRADAAALPFPDAYFDTVNIANAIHCFPDVDGALRDIFRVLKPGGTLAVNALLFPRGAWPLKPIAESIDQWGIRKGILYMPFTQEGVREKFLQAGYKLRAETMSGNCCDFLLRKPALPLTAFQKMARQAVEPSMERLITTQWRRVLAVGGLVVRLALHKLRTEVWSWLYRLVAERRQRAEVRDQLILGRLLQKKLGALKGPLMKFGQMASYLDDRLSSTLRESLAPLQDRSPSLDAKQIRALVERSLGGSIEAEFAEWEDRPLAAASIAQIHLARLHTGEQVAVKVKYPGIEASIRSDLRFIRLLAPWLSRRLGVANIQQLLEEFGSMILGECDFVSEATHQEFFRQAFLKDNDVVIPRVYPSHSTRDVLTMDFIDGKTLAEFQKDANRAQKNRTGEIIARVAATSINRFCIYNGDPHPGNYLFLADGRVAFLDFGFTRQFPQEFIDLHKRQALAGYQGDRESFEVMSRRLGYESDRIQTFRELMDVLRAGPYSSWLEDKPFHFTHRFVRNELAMVAQFYRQHSPVKLSRTHLILQRVMWGQHALFADLDAEINLHRIVLPLLQEPFPQGEREAIVELPASPLPIHVRPIQNIFELWEVYRLTHDCYVETGYIRSRPTGLLVHYAEFDHIPETMILVAVQGQEIVGSVSFTVDGPSGFVIEKDYPEVCQQIREEGRALADVWRLVVKKSCRAGQQVLMELVGETVRALRHMGVTTCFLEVHEKHEGPYRKLLNMVPVARRQGVEGLEKEHIPAVLLRLDEERLPERWKLGVRKKSA
jgi:predicted unusual protein kinase regulating ubiquinone biosynthesis (AarF/ABC1/UbiB family)/ubiquinone/menaquinone biosynthesis C-methylase UbiE